MRNAGLPLVPVSAFGNQKIAPFSLQLTFLQYSANIMRKSASSLEDWQVASPRLSRSALPLQVAAVCYRRQAQSVEFLLRAKKRRTHSPGRVVSTQTAISPALPPLPGQDRGQWPSPSTTAFRPQLEDRKMQMRRAWIRVTRRSHKTDNVPRARPAFPPATLSRTLPNARSSSNILPSRRTRRSCCRRVC